MTAIPFCFRRTSAAALCALPLLLWWQIHEAFCWFDEGHMLIGEVARQVMPREDLGRIEEILSLWEADYPDQSNVSTASPWLDHVGCQDVSLFCSTGRQDGFKLMGSFHYTSFPWNPLNMEESSFMKSLPPDKSGAAWAMEAAYESLKTHLPDPLKTQLNSYGVRMTLNLTLRAFLHIFQDAHMPLHMMVTFSKAFRKGDMGGNKVRVFVGDESNGATVNLHYLWDAAGGAHFRLRQHFPKTMAEIEARHLRETFPPEHFKERLRGDLDGTVMAAIARETHDVARAQVFHGASDPWLTSTYDAVHKIDSAELKRIAYVAREQLALAGYRLANALQQISKFLPRRIEVVSIARNPEMCLREAGNRL